MPLALKLLDADSKLPKEQRRFNRADTLHAIADLDLDIVNKLALAGDETAPDGLRAYLFAKGAEKDPANVELATLNLLQNPECKLYAAVEAGITVAPTDPGLAEQLYQIAKPLYDGSAHGDRHGYRTIEGLGAFPDISLRMVALAGLLQKQADLDAMFSQLNELLKKSTGMGYMITQPLLEAAGRVSPEFVLKVYDSIDNQFKSGYLGQAVTSMAKRDPVAAQRLLGLIEARRRDGEGVIDVLPVVKALGKKNPAAALALVNTLPYYRVTMGLLQAAVFQPKDTAKTMLQQVFADEHNRTIVNIAQANAVDPDFAKDLYTRYKKTLETQSYHFTDRYSADGSSTADRVQYAYLISSLDPVEARLILETEFADALSKIPPDGQRFSLQFFPLAMCSLDLDRAQQMLDTLNVDNADFRNFLQQRLIQYILMSREERVSAPFF